MKFGTVDAGWGAVAVVVSSDDNQVFPLAEPLEALIPRGLAPLLSAGRDAQSGSGIPLAQVRVLRPFRPASVRDFVTFEEHVVGVRKSVDGASGVPEQWYAAPTFYFTNPHAIVGPDEPIARPDSSRALDFELEVAAVLGSGGTSLTESEADESIIGYTIFNDWSARDIQSAEMKVGLGPAKGKDLGSSLGPWLVTADALADCRDGDGFLDLLCTVSVNDVEVGRDSLANMGWRFATMVAYASRDSLVLPLDVLASGTTGGGGCLAELWGRRGEQSPPPIEPGDVVTITVDRLGTLRTPVIAGAPAPELSSFRRR